MIFGKSHCPISLVPFLPSVRRTVPPGSGVPQRPRPWLLPVKMPGQILLFIREGLPWTHLNLSKLNSERLAAATTLLPRPWSPFHMAPGTRHFFRRSSLRGNCGTGDLLPGVVNRQHRGLQGLQVPPTGAGRPPPPLEVPAGDGQGGLSSSCLRGEESGHPRPCDSASAWGRGDEEPRRRGGVMTSQWRLWETSSWRGPGTRVSKDVGQ